MAPAGDEPVDEYLEADKQHGEGNVADGQNGEQCEREQRIARSISADVNAGRSRRICWCKGDAPAPV